MYKYADFDVLIFDLGNTILPIAPKLTVEAFHKLGFNGNVLNPLPHIAEKLDYYQQGRLTNSEFLTFLQQELPTGITQEQIKHAWNAMLLNFPQAHLELLKNLKQKHTLLLLSNTNALHTACFEAKAALQSTPLQFYFDKIYYSHELGMSKPNREIYAYVHEKHHLNNKKVLFLDDLSENLQIPNQMGWTTAQISQDITILHFQ